eukprot:58718-Pleurochrysis_carterae.AAC.1
MYTYRKRRVNDHSRPGVPPVSCLTVPCLARFVTSNERGSAPLQAHHGSQKLRFAVCNCDTGYMSLGLDAQMAHLVPTLLP